MKRLALYLSRKLLKWSGDAAAKEWERLTRERDAAIVQAGVTQQQMILDNIRRNKLREILKELLNTCRLADGLLSSGMNDKGQSMLREGLLTAAHYEKWL